MEHTQIVTPSELAQYAERRDSEAIIPELIYLLIRASVIEIQECRIPYGDTVNQPGWDGLLEVPASFRQFVPANKSYWEIGTGGNPGDKATDDFKKRTRSMSASNRALATYVFVTPRSAGKGGWPEPAQTRWKQRREKFGWHRISILDGQKLADWLREFPALSIWLAKKIGTLNTNTALSTPAEHWGRLRSMAVESDLKHFHQVFLVGRERAYEQLQRLFSGEINQLLLMVESQEDAEDFVAAFLEAQEIQIQQQQINQCLFIKSADAWLSFSELRKSHIFVANPKIDIESNSQLLQAARQNGHRVIIPVSGRWANNGTENIFPLRSPSKGALESVLRETGFSPERARELASVGALNLSALKRHLQGLGDLPPYATWPNARVLAVAGLIGTWQGDNVHDREVLATLLGKPYGEWIETARELALAADTPLIQRNEKWKMVSRGEAWSALGPRLTNDDLERFKQVAITVLQENDPKFELQPEEHYLAQVKGKTLSYSYELRHGLAESIALLGSCGTALCSCNAGKAEQIAFCIVRDLLDGADWLRWASLNGQLPMLAEASPKAFLDAVENALNEPSTSPFKFVFSLESNAFGGSNYMTGLLWALEGLAWHADYLIQATIILGDLANIDPGGKWANRPVNSIIHIFLPWYPQTASSIDVRFLAIEALIREQPEVGWKVLIGLLPTGHGFSTGTHRTVWRRLIPEGWKEGNLTNEYNTQVLNYASLLVDLVANNLEKLTYLIDRLPDLPKPAHDRVLNHLGSDRVKSLPEEERTPIWENLVKLAREHKKYSDANWAMSAEAVSNIEAVAATLAPHQADLLHHNLFTERDFDLYEDTSNFEGQQVLLDQRRIAAIADILLNHGINGVLTMLKKVEAPRKVGQALGSVKSDEVDFVLLPDYLEHSDSILEAFINAFVWSRQWEQKLTWVDTQLAKGWNWVQKAAFLKLLPFSDDVWQRVDQHLGVNAKAYWEKTHTNSGWSSDTNIIFAIGKLLEVGRGDAAIHSLAMLMHEKRPFPPALAVDALKITMKLLNSSNAQIHQYEIQELIKWLQNSLPLDSEELFQVEWNYFVFLDPAHGGGRTKSIEYRIATYPAFFCQLIAMVFKPKNTSNEIVESEVDENLVQHAYRVLDRCKRVAGISQDGIFIPEDFDKWLSDVKAITTNTGHLEIAMDRVGKILSNAPPDPNGLWIHCMIANALNSKDADIMRSAFIVALYNKRGAFWVSGGLEEMKLSKVYREKSDALLKNGFHRLADAVRDLANGYEQEAKRQMDGLPFYE